MRFPYSQQLSPPGLMLPITLRVAGTAQTVSTEAKIDTGADMSVVPLRLAMRLKLDRIGRRNCQGALHTGLVPVPTFFLEISFDDIEYVALEVLATTRQTALLGRDILNGLVLLADGPQQYFELNIPRK